MPPRKTLVVGFQGLTGEGSPYEIYLSTLYLPWKISLTASFPIFEKTPVTVAGSSDFFAPRFEEYFFLKYNWHTTFNSFYFRTLYFFSPLLYFFPPPFSPFLWCVLTQADQACCVAEDGPELLLDPPTSTF